MSRINALKGFEDVLPAQAGKWQAVERIARETARLYRFDEIRTPILESANVFNRAVGETSDMVKKETYTFADRDGEMVTLRPEGTAGAARAVIEAGLLNDEGARVKVFYIGANFRHEKPQKGRVRQHMKFGVEAYGVADAEQDVECILLQLDFYRRCGLKQLSLRINSLGDAESKASYRDALVGFLKPKSAALSEDSQRRLETNPLRILDSKDPRDVAACVGAPAAVDFLSEKSTRDLNRARQLLDQAGATYKLDGTLVRGFDYYTGILWEVTAEGLGSQNAVGGGGRYDNLVENLGGRPTPAVGFGAGIERLIIALDAQGANLTPEKPKLVWLAHLGEAAREANLKLLSELRSANIAADMDLGLRKIKDQFKLADKAGATLCLVTGDDELAAGQVMLKNLLTKQQEKVARSQIVQQIASL